MQPLRQRTAVQIATWTSAAAVGVAAVLYARLIAVTQGRYFVLFSEHPRVLSVLSPLFFVAAVYIVDRFAPEARGSGIPQVLQALDIAHGTKDPNDDSVWRQRLISLPTAGIKIISSWLGILGGASIGREGPTIQVAASAFASIGAFCKKHLAKPGNEPVFDIQSFLIAGGAAGVAAAFNTPLAGITFALEEIGEGSLGRFRQTVMLGVILAGVTSIALSGDYLYFGHPTLIPPTIMLVPETITIGLLGGLLGGAFARLLAFPDLARLPGRGWKRAAFCGAVCALIGLATGGDTAGSGYEVTRKYLESAQLGDWNVLFSLEKMVTTVLSYVSGMAGGIFSPCLSMGAGIGFSFAKIAGLANFKECALIGMVAFFSGAVQAPLTAVIIVMEMTDEHIMILPFMVSAFIALEVGKKLMPVPLYRYLATSATYPRLDQRHKE